MSPVFFILVSLTFTSAMLSVIFLMAWKTQGHKKYALTWSITFAVATIQWTVNLFAGSFPTHELYWVVVNAITLGTVSLGMLGHCQRVHSQFKVCRLWFPPVLCYALLVWFTYGAPHVGLRTGLVAAYAAITLFISAALIIRHREKPRPAEWGAAITIAIFGLSQIVAATAAFMQGPVLDQHLSEIYNMVNFLALPAAYAGMGMFVIFMLASDLSEQMKEIAVVDQLTGLLNRRGFNESGGKAYATARRTDRQVSVIITDIDHFKKINDMHGHSTGDDALVHFANVLQAHRRDEDVLARIGGEEFAIVLPGSSVEKSIKIAEELCGRLGQSPMTTELDDLVMTASFGVATISINDTSLFDIVVRADAALYRSKRAGRNRIDLESSQMMLMPTGELKPVTT